MAQSQLTVRTLGLAMVALVLACVHAARGDGSRSSTVVSFSPTNGSSAGRTVATFSSSTAGGSSQSVYTVKGDPWVDKSDRSRSTTPDSSRRAQVQKAQAAKARATAQGGRGTGSYFEQMCVVRRVSCTDPSKAPEPLIPARVVSAGKPALAKAPPPQPNAKFTPLKNPQTTAQATGPATAQTQPDASKFDLKRNGFALTPAMMVP